MESEIIRILKERLQESKKLTLLAQQKLDFERKEFVRNWKTQDGRRDEVSENSDMSEKNDQAVDLVLDRIEKMNEKLIIELDKLSF